MAVSDQAYMHHTCFVVNDIEKAAQELTDTLGVSWRIWNIEPDHSTVRGENVPFTFRAAIAWIDHSEYELIQPLTGESLYVEHLRTKGEGLHHTCLSYPTREAMHSARDELLAKGREMVQSASLLKSAEFCCFDMPEMGSILELLYYDPENLQEPDMTIGDFD